MVIFALVNGPTVYLIWPYSVLSLLLWVLTCMTKKKKKMYKRHFRSLYDSDMVNVRFFLFFFFSHKRIEVRMYCINI